jgi:heme exporter protein D
MIWSSFSDFWSMGGYGLYVWGSFGVTALLMAAEAFWTRRGRRNALSHVLAELRASDANGKDWR